MRNVSIMIMKIWFLAITTSLSIGFLGESLFSAEAVLGTVTKGGVMAARYGYKKLTPSFKAKMKKKASKVVPFMKQPKMLERTVMDFNLPSHYTPFKSPTMKMLQSTFACDKGVVKIQFSGAAGSGKTTFAHQYAKTEGEKPDGSTVIWELSGDNSASFFQSLEQFTLFRLGKDGLRTLKSQLKDTEVEDVRDDKIFLLTTFMSFLKVHSTANGKRWFLIIDSVDNFASMREYLSLFNQENCGNGNIIITTREHTHWQEDMYTYVDCSKFTLPEAAGFFGSIVDASVLKRIADLESFVGELPPFPLDLSLAAAHLRYDESSTGESYLRSYKTHSREFALLQEELAAKYIDDKENNTRYRAVTIALEDIVGDSLHFSPLLLIITLFYEDDIPRDLIKALYAQYDQIADIDATWALVERVLIQSGFMNKHPSKSNKLIMHRFTKPIVRSYTFDVLCKSFGGRRDDVFSKVIMPFFEEYKKFLKEDVEPSNSNIYLKREHFAHITSFMDFWRYFGGPQEGLQYFWILQGRLSKEIEGEDIEGGDTPTIAKLGYLDRMSSGSIRIDTPTSASSESLRPAGKLSKDELFIKKVEKYVEEGKCEKAIIMYRRLFKKKGLVPRLKAKVLISLADLYFWGENGIEKNIAKAKKYAHRALEIDTIDEEDRTAAKTLLEDDSDTDTASSTASTHTPVPRKTKSLTASKSLTISKASTTSTKDSDELADTPKRSTASSPRLPIATAIILDPGTLKLQEAQSCYESGHYKSALLKYRIITSIPKVKGTIKAKALVACAEIFYGDYGIKTRFTSGTKLCKSSIGNIRDRRGKQINS